MGPGGLVAENFGTHLFLGTVKDLNSNGSILTSAATDLGTHICLMFF